MSFPDTDNILVPNPWVVSDKLFKRKDGKFIPDERINLLAGAWIQFMIHDWFNHGTTTARDPYLIPTDNKGPALHVFHTAPDPTYNKSSGLPPSFINTVTHWWDGSQIYGIDDATSTRLRTRNSGKLRLTPSGSIPTDPKTGLPIIGQPINNWLGVTAIHTLFVREHNVICDMLRKAYPTWTDQMLFDKARLINTAGIAKIHTLEWTTAMLQNELLYAGMNANWYGFPPFNLPPLVGSPDPLNVTHQLTEEFTAIYRMHPLLPESITISRLQQSPKPNTTYSLGDLVFDNQNRILAAETFLDIINTFGRSAAGALTLRNYPTFLRNFSKPPSDSTTAPGQGKASRIDLAATEILRDRERGLPRYNSYRRAMGMAPFTTFEEITTDTVLVNLLKEVYNNDIEKVDLLTGQLAEQSRPPGFTFSDTTFRVFIVVASRRLMADRFFTTQFNEGTYTPEGMAWVRNNATFAGVLERNEKGLKGVLGGLGVVNAFVPWADAGRQTAFREMAERVKVILAQVAVNGTTSAVATGATVRTA
ncbi:hypothetical protein HDV00_007033 [Rhizophlyctis rosea]|nr:hypothetical protein HDV00_007033 [Rhizophlyctis rosea]